MCNFAARFLTRMSMKKIRTIISAVLLSMTTGTVWAGGLVTNTNQSASFLRNPSRDAVIDIDGVYMNPAGISFLKKGFHLGATIQNAHQHRDVTTTFPTLAGNMTRPGQTTVKYEGKAIAPVIPSIQAAYVWDKWTASMNFSLGGGGGKCEFEDGIGSIETAYSMLLPSTVNAMLATIPGAPLVNGYTFDSYMKGRQYYFGFQLGGGYKFNDNLSAYLGLRAVYATCNYNGYVNNINVYADGVNLKSALPAPAAAMLQAGLDANNIELNNDQSGMGFTPIIGLNWRINKHWNLAAKYEARTKLMLKNKTHEYEAPAAAAAVLGKYNDQVTEKDREDIPGILTAGAMYSPIEKVRLHAGWHYYFDKQAKQYGDRQDKIDKGTMELSAGAEWDIHKVVTVSAGWQGTYYRLSDDYMQDMSFTTSSNMMCVGLRLRATERCSFDLGYMQNFYHGRDVQSNVVISPTASLPKTDHYKRTNIVFAVGVNLDF